MAKDPAFLFYSSDFLVGTNFMSYEQKGKYITLLCLQHQHGRLHEKHMLNICESFDDDIFIKFIKDENGHYYNSRLEDEIQKRQNYCESRRINRNGNNADDKPKKVMKSGQKSGQKSGKSGAESAHKSGFKRPNLDEVIALFNEKGHKSDAESFYDYYESNGWKVGRNPMKKWKSAASNWIRNKRLYEKIDNNNKVTNLKIDKSKLLQ